MTGTVGHGNEATDIEKISVATIPTDALTVTGAAYVQDAVTLGDEATDTTAITGLATLAGMISIGGAATFFGAITLSGHEEETTEPVCHTRVDQSVEPLPAQTASVCQVTKLPEREPGAENTHETPVLSGQMQRRASQRKRAREAEDSVPSQQAHTQPEAVSRLRTLTRGLAPPHEEPKDLSVSEDLLPLLSPWTYAKAMQGCPCLCSSSSASP